jgi:hypothetical protein
VSSVVLVNGSQKNGLLTSSHKLAYGGLKAHYASALNALHQQIEDNRRHTISRYTQTCWAREASEL